VSRGRRLFSHERLTPREHDVLKLVAEGLHDEEIAERLGIARSTVAAVLRSAMATLGVRTRVQAVMKLAEKS
jgi:DNA-binding CsgD family transcriptional regulator